MNTQLSLPLTDGDAEDPPAAPDCHHTYMTFSTAWGATKESARSGFIDKHGEEPNQVFYFKNHLIFAGPIPEGL